MKYSILEIAGKQFRVELGKPFEVTMQVFDLEAQARRGEALEAKILMEVDEKKVSIGKPYLKDIVKLKVLEQKKGKKIRVAKFHAKANYRRVRGFRPQISKVVLED